MPIFKKSKPTKIDQNFINKTIIGLGYGLIKTRDLILNKQMGITTQDAMDSLSLWIGREFMKEMLDKQIVKVSEQNEKVIQQFINYLQLGEQVDLDVTEKLVKIVVQKCKICPKRIGGYDLEGNTACPVGGLLTGAISYIKGIDPIVVKNKLQTAEICHIEMELK